MEEKILEAVIKSFVTEFTNQTKSFLIGLGDEVKHFLGSGLLKYLEKQKEKYSYIKTLLKGLSPVYIYDIYYPLKLEYKNTTIETNTIKNIFKVSKYLTLIGDAGSGKSTLIKHLFLNTIAEKEGIPILVELRDLNKFNGNIKNYITEKIFENNLSVNSKILDRLLSSGKFVFFLDGYDELTSEIKKMLLLI